MAYTLLVSTTPEERRVALLEGATLREFYTEYRYDRGLVGNIFKGRVVRVMPGMNAAFVEIGVGRAAFLQMEDLPAIHGPARDELSPAEGDPDGRGGPGTGGWGDPEVETVAAPAPGPAPLAVDQDVLVQVLRPPTPTKGPRVTTTISLAGRNLVFLPRTPVLGVSRRIEDRAERARLKAAVASLLPPGAGAVIRTAALHRPEAELVDDLRFLAALWQRIEQYAEDLEAPALVHEDLDLLLRTARDLLTEGCDRMVVDTEADYDRLLQFVDSFMPEMTGLVEWYRDPDPLFERHGIEQAVSGLLNRTVWLKSGGSIVIDHAEALTAIDVNTGRYTGKADPEETALKTNLEAAHEIGEQLRLRNIGGLVVIDFIDMRLPENRQKVFDALRASLARDKAVMDVVPMSPLGLVELSRRRVREGLFAHLTEPCPYCDGRGWIRSVEQTCGEILRKVTRELASSAVRGVRIQAHPRVIECLIDNYRLSLADLETTAHKPIRLVRREDQHLETYSILRE